MITDRLEGESRKGITLRYFIRLIIVLVLAVMVIGGQGPFWDALTTGSQREFATMDVKRALSPFLLLSGQGSAVLEINMFNSYDAIAVDSGSIELGADFLDSTRSIQLPSGYTYSGSASGESFCVHKSGDSYHISDSCLSDNDVSCASSALGGGQRCSTFSGQASGPSEGFICKNGTYVRENFFTTYYNDTGSGCSPQNGDAFTELNSFSVPGTAVERDNGYTVGVGTSFSFDCKPEDEVSDPYEVTVEFRQYHHPYVSSMAGPDDDPVLHETTYDCESGVRHVRDGWHVPAGAFNRIQNTANVGNLLIYGTITRPDGTETRVDGPLDGDASGGIEPFEVTMGGGN